MNIESGVDIDAPAAVVWDVFSDVERWPEWTASITRLVALDGPGLAVGKRFEIEQPRMPTLVWEVTAVEPGASWTWVTRSPGAVTTARHDLTPLSGGRTRMRQQLEQSGPMGTLVGLLLRRQSRRYLELEAAGLKARSEERRVDGPAA